MIIAGRKGESGQGTIHVVGCGVEDNAELKNGWKRRAYHRASSMFRREGEEHEQDRYKACLRDEGGRGTKTCRTTNCSRIRDNDRQQHDHD